MSLVQELPNTQRISDIYYQFLIGNTGSVVVSPKVKKSVPEAVKIKKVVKVKKPKSNK